MRWIDVYPVHAALLSRQAMQCTQTTLENYRALESFLTWLEGQGLLDDRYQPTAAFSRLKDLITRRWRTQEGRNSGPAGSRRPASASSSWATC